MPVEKIVSDIEIRDGVIVGVQSRSPRLGEAQRGSESPKDQPNSNAAGGLRHSHAGLEATFVLRDFADFDGVVRSNASDPSVDTSLNELGRW